MRTNIIIDDALLDEAMRAGPYKTKKDAVEAGLKLLARRAAYHDILALRGKLQWDDPETSMRSNYRVEEPRTAYKSKATSPATKVRKAKPTATPKKRSGK